MAVAVTQTQIIFDENLYTLVLEPIELGRGCGSAAADLRAKMHECFYHFRDSMTIAAVVSDFGLGDVGEFETAGPVWTHGQRSAFYKNFFVPVEADDVESLPVIEGDIVYRKR